MAKTTRLGLSLLAAGQAQKEVTHNEALLILDALVQACCSVGPSNSPPQTPQTGLCYLCDAAPTGAWTGHAGDVACWTDGGWRFVKPFEGLQITDQVAGTTWRFLAGQWTSGVVRAAEVQIDGRKVLGAQRPAISSPSGGSIVDVEARYILAQVLQALRSHGLIAASG